MMDQEVKPMSYHYASSGSNLYLLHKFSQGSDFQFSEPITLDTGAMLPTHIYSY